MPRSRGAEERGAEEQGAEEQGAGGLVTPEENGVPMSQQKASEAGSRLLRHRLLSFNST